MGVITVKGFFDIFLRFMWAKKIAQYLGDFVMFLLNKIIKNKKMKYLQKNVGRVQGLLNNPWFYCTWFRK